MSTSATIDELLLRWQELRRRDPFPSVRDLCADRPELVEELERRIAAFESMEAMLGMEPGTTRPGSAAPHGVPPHLAEKLRPLGYELLAVIDHGGMGVVYKAVQVKLRRVVALKMIGGFRVGPRQLARFRTEAEAVARLQHPHIVQIHEVGEVDGHSFFSMEYVEGGTLASRLADGPLQPADAAALVETLARAVHHAHTRGIVHRDLKPSNILLKDEGGGMKDETEQSGSSSSFIPPPSSFQPKVTDFGLAKQLGADAGHTATGEVIGTPAYMAPEQAEGKTDGVGPVIDVYALGAILYEALTGHPPFKANTVLETLRQVTSEDPPLPRGVRPAVPPDLEAVCLRCLEKNPRRRYATAEALADDLRRFLAGQPVAARPLSVAARAARWARRHRFVAGAVLLALVGALVAGAVVAAQEYVERERVRKRAVELAPQAREILHRHCFECHGANPAKAERRFLVLDRASLLDPHRRNVVPGRPADSRLIQRIEDGTMPPEEDELRLPRVSEQELAILKGWIAGGAPGFPEEDPGTPPVVPEHPMAAAARAVFVKHCYHCHRVAEAGGGIKILNHPLLVSQRKVVIPGKPDESELYQLLVTTDEVLMMPPQTEPRLTPEEIAVVRRWIEAGAPPFTRASGK